MARPKTFDRTQILDKVVELFWDWGYEATSINDLLDYLGIRHQSLYDTFGDKHGLFLEALERYDQQYKERYSPERFYGLSSDTSSRGVIPLYHYSMNHHIVHLNHQIVAC
jgi:AcrR family transcriptional regulator